MSFIIQPIVHGIVTNIVQSITAGADSIVFGALLDDSGEALLDSQGSPLLEN